MQCSSRRIHPAWSASAPDESGGSGVLTIVEGSCDPLRDAPEAAQRHASVQTLRRAA